MSEQRYCGQCGEAFSADEKSCAYCGAVRVQASDSSSRGLVIAGMAFLLLGAALFILATIGWRFVTGDQLLDEAQQIGNTSPQIVDTRSSTPALGNDSQGGPDTNSAESRIPTTVPPQSSEEIPAGLEPLATLVADGTAGEPILVENPGLPGRLVFLYEDISTQEHAILYVMQADGSDLVKLVDGPISFEELNWNPATRQFGFILYESGWEGGSRPFLVRADATEIKQLPFHSANVIEFELSPSSQDGIAFLGYEKSIATNIYLGNSQSGSFEEVERVSISNSGLAWSASGRYLVFQCAGDSGLCLLDMQSSEGARELDWASNGAWFGASQGIDTPRAAKPAWAPDSERIAFAINANHDSVNPQICVLDIESDEGSCWPAPNAVVTSNVGNLTWSPDGNFVAYSAYYARDAVAAGKLPLSNIAAINVNSGEFYKLTASNAPDSNRMPLWISDEPPIDGPIIKEGELLSARVDSGETFMDPKISQALDALSVEGVVQALIQAFADNDRASFDYLVERSAESPDEVWSNMGDGCLGVNAEILSYVISEDGISVFEYVVEWKDETVGRFTVHQRPDGTAKIVEGGANCGTAASSASGPITTQTSDEMATPTAPPRLPATPIATIAAEAEAPAMEVSAAESIANDTPQISADIVAAPASSPILIDGDVSDWTVTDFFESSNLVYSVIDWDGTNDLQVIWQLTWDDDALYVAAQITDNIHVQTRSDNRIHLGDSLEMQIDTDVSGDWQSTGLNTDDFQIAMSPGDFVSVPPVVYRFRGQQDGSMVELAGHSIAVAALPTLEGYNLELAIPWSDLSITPEPDLILGLALNANDNDTPGAEVQEVMLSSAPDRVFDNPRTWGTLTLK